LIGTAGSPRTPWTARRGRSTCIDPCHSRGGAARARRQIRRYPRDERGGRQSDAAPSGRPDRKARGSIGCRGFFFVHRPHPPSTSLLNLKIG
jgi:hypothetical protein